MTTDPFTDEQKKNLFTLYAAFIASGIYERETAFQEALSSMHYFAECLSERPDAAHAQMTPGSERDEDDIEIPCSSHDAESHSIYRGYASLGFVRRQRMNCTICAAALADYEAKQKPVKSVYEMPEWLGGTPASPIASAEAFAQLLFKHGFTADSAGLGWKAQIGKLWLEIEQSFTTASEELRAENTRLAADLHEFKVMVDNERFAHQKSKDKLAEVTRERDEAERSRHQVLKDAFAFKRERDEARGDLKGTEERLETAKTNVRHWREECGKLEAAAKCSHEYREQRDAALALAEQAEKQLQGHNDALVVAFCQGGHARSEATAYNWIYEAEKAARTLLAAGKLGVKE